MGITFSRGVLFVALGAFRERTCFMSTAKAGSRRGLLIQKFLAGARGAFQSASGLKFAGGVMVVHPLD